MAVEKNAGDLDHIEFQREPTRQPEIRRRSPFGQAPPRPTSRPTHAQDVAHQTTDALNLVTASRQASGVDPSMLLVLEFDSITKDLRDQLEERFDAVVVDEQRRKVNDQNHFRYVVQFSDRNALTRFEQEIEHYRNENQTTSTLPYGARRDFFDALQHTRAVSRDEREGQRLKEEGIPNSSSFYLDVDLWHPGNANAAQQLRQEIRNLCQTRFFFMYPWYKP